MAGEKKSNVGVCLVIYPERMFGKITYEIEHKGMHPMMGNDIYRGEAKVQDLMVAPPKDWTPICRDFKMCGSKFGCQSCPFIKKDGGQQ